MSFNAALMSISFVCSFLDSGIVIARMCSAMCRLTRNDGDSNACRKLFAWVDLSKFLFVFISSRVEITASNKGTKERRASCLSTQRVSHKPRSRFLCDCGYIEPIMSRRAERIADFLKKFAVSFTVPKQFRITPT